MTTRLISLGILLLSGVTWADADGEAELRSLQGKQASSFKEFYKALKSPGDKTPTELAQQHLAPAENQMNQFLGHRQAKMDHLMYGKVYQTNGSVLPIEQARLAEKNSPNADSDEDRSPARSGEAQSSMSFSSDSGSSSSYSTPNYFGRGGRKGPVLDGSNIPKEMSFPGKN